ncbi:hypothetical protein OF829_11525 [Sphingomonas sp. LB-2]|uniref:hypothetical protein n=1 Tax=Sphingomonas caeni TaxID=2984949 RepID=UPI002231460D|nr:hypothetical protein [Sphingomonas caeni]MCW3847871.1 hypothetical protein [Sphingomonas caeni]
MMHDHDYYRRREQQERETAERCDEPGARRIHLELAERYAALVREPLMARPVQL